jgi:hypothetical protein
LVAFKYPFHYLLKWILPISISPSSATPRFDPYRGIQPFLPGEDFSIMNESNPNLRLDMLSEYLKFGTN